MGTVIGTRKDAQELIGPSSGVSRGRAQGRSILNGAVTYLGNAGPLAFRSSESSGIRNASCQTILWCARCRRPDEREGDLPAPSGERVMANRRIAQEVMGV